MTATVLTSARPIMSADAVVAVRRGVRCALRLASLPATERVIGQIGKGRIRLIAALMGAANEVDKLATPRNNKMAPSPLAPSMPMAPPG